MSTKGLVIAGLAGGSGKSVVSVGIAAAFARSARVVVPFKKGPDYIDAGWLQLGAENKCYNLDPYLMSKDAILRSFWRQSAGADIVIVEGNRGLFDGVDAQGGYSTAELAVTLDLPILLVVNCTKMTRTVAAMVLGCQLFDKRLDIRGVVLNQIATERQKRLISEAVLNYTGIPVVGSIPRLKYDIFPMRHLGMIPHQEYSDSSNAIRTLGDLVVDNVDLARVEQLMKPVEASEIEELPATHVTAGSIVRIGVMQDAAFQFYYSENLEALENEGAELVYIDATQDAELPAIDGLYIGGGFPETSARKLADNVRFRESVKNAATAGLPIYAECGGLIYLGRSINIADEEYPLVDIFPVKFGMSSKPQAHGYSIFRVEQKTPYFATNEEVKGHEFRYSTVLSWEGEDTQLAVKMLRGTGFRGGRDGLTYNNVFALYTHIHAAGSPRWAGRFVRCCRAAMMDPSALLSP